MFSLHSTLMPGCNVAPLVSEGSVSNSNFIALALSLSSESDARPFFGGRNSANCVSETCTSLLFTRSPPFYVRFENGNARDYFICRCVYGAHFAPKFFDIRAQSIENPKREGLDYPESGKQNGFIAHKRAARGAVKRGGKTARGKGAPRKG